MIKKEDVFKIGQFAKPHGVKGEISLVTDYDLFDDSEDDYIVCDMDGILVPFLLRIIDINRIRLFCLSLKM